MKLQSKIYLFPLLLALLCVVLLMSSCGGHKNNYKVYDTYILSKQLNIPIDEKDKHLPLYMEVSEWLGTPYKYGGNSKRGTDCSGFVLQVYSKIYDKKLERSSDGQATKNVKKVGKGNLKTGDLVFFRTASKSKKIDHVGIYLKDNRFIHASTSRGVIVSSLDEAYYKRTWRKGGRVK